MVVWCIPTQVVSYSYRLNQFGSLYHRLILHWTAFMTKCSRLFWKCPFLLADVGTPSICSCVCCSSMLDVWKNCKAEGCFYFPQLWDCSDIWSFQLSWGRVFGAFSAVAFQLTTWLKGFHVGHRLIIEELHSLEQYFVWVQILRSHSFLFPWPGKSPCPPLKERKVQKLQESPNFSAQLGNPLLPAKRGMQKPKASSAGTILSLPFTETHQASVKSL